LQTVLATMGWILAQGAGGAATAPASRPAAAKPWWFTLFFESMFGPMALLLLIMWFFLIRGRKNEQKQREEMLGSMKRGDRVQTIGGVLGTVVDVRDSEVVVKVDESSNTKMTFIRSAIHRVVTEKKAAETK
jgi:preprotein translocase subunit YajC